MSARLRLVAAVLVLGWFAAGMALAADGVKTYQVTGAVVELTDAKIVVEKKDGDKWEIARNADTKVTGELKVGSKVTVKYRMTAADVAVKEEKAEKKAE